MSSPKKRKRDRQVAPEEASGSTSQSTHKRIKGSKSSRASESRSPFAPGDVKPYISMEGAFGRGKLHKRKRESGNPSSSVLDANRIASPSTSAQTSAALQDNDAVKEEDASLPLPKKKKPKRNGRKSKKSESVEVEISDSTVRQQEEGEEEKPTDSALAVAIFTSDLPEAVKEESNDESSVKSESAEPAEDVLLVEPIEAEGKKKGKGKGRAPGWAAGLDSSPSAMPNVKDPAIETTTMVLAPPIAEFEALKVEVERLKHEMAFKTQLLHAHQDMTTFLQDALNCSICLSTYSDPLALSCGHVFCRSCLKTCFLHTRDQASTSAKATRLECPSCRHKIISRPFPVFIVRDLTSRIRQHEAPGGLLYTGDVERAATKSPARKPAGLPEEDDWDGLFQAEERNRSYARAVRRGLLDHDDGVVRCVTCNWELEDDVCLRCNEVYEYPQESDLDDGEDLLLFGADVDLQDPSDFGEEDEEDDLSDLIAATVAEQSGIFSGASDDEFVFDGRPVNPNRSSELGRFRNRLGSRYNPAELDTEEEEDLSAEVRDLQQYSSGEEQASLSQLFNDVDDEPAGRSQRRRIVIPDDSEDESDGYQMPPEADTRRSRSRIVDTDSEEDEDVQGSDTGGGARENDSDRISENGSASNHLSPHMYRRSLSPARSEAMYDQMFANAYEDQSHEDAEVFMHEPADYSDLEEMEGEDLGGRGLVAQGQYLHPDSEAEDESDAEILDEGDWRDEGSDLALEEFDEGY